MDGREPMPAECGTLEERIGRDPTKHVAPPGRVASPRTEV